MYIGPHFKYSSSLWDLGCLFFSVPFYCPGDCISHCDSTESSQNFGNAEKMEPGKFLNSTLSLMKRNNTISLTLKKIECLVQFYIIVNQFLQIINEDTE